MKVGKNMIVRYANELARKYSKFTLEEQKVLHLIFSQIKPFEKNPTTFKLNKLEFFNKLELESKDRYPRYRKLVRGLIDKSFFEVKNDQGDEYLGVVIIGSNWKPKEPTFEVDLHPKFMPYLEQLVRDYTKIDLNSVLKLKSKHALILYKFICSWTDEKKLINQRYLTTKELKELLGLSIDDYVFKGKFNRAGFEKWVIKPIIAEINEKTNINVKFKKNKEHNKVKNYQFNWNLKEKEVKNTVFKHEKSELLEEIKLKEECSITHKDMYEENDCKKIHWLKGNGNSNGINFFGDDADSGIVWDWDNNN